MSIRLTLEAARTAEKRGNLPLALSHFMAVWVNLPPGDKRRKPLEKKISRITLDVARSGLISGS